MAKKVIKFFGYNTFLKLAVFSVIFFVGFFCGQNFAHANLLTNGDFSTGDTTGWTVIENGGSGATYADIYATSHQWCSISQTTVDLTTVGYAAEQLDAQPGITFSVDVAQRGDVFAPGIYTQYYLTFTLLDSEDSQIATYNIGTVGSPTQILAGQGWIENSYTFTSYGAGVRKVYMKIAGEDGNRNWGGQYGPWFDNASITISDTTDPTVSYLSPADNAIGVGVDATFEINFNEAIATSSGDIVLYKASDNSVVETIDITDTSGKITASSTTALIIDPSTTLASETEYYFTIASTTIDDLSGNSYAGATTTEWSFTTADVENPTVIYFSPVNNATDIALDATFEIAFNETIATSTGNIVFYKASDNSVFETIDIADTSGLITASGTTALIIDPDADFSYETEYYITIASTTIDDASGNSYAGATTTEWSFTTLDTPTCPTIANAATYNSYPTCGVATCNSGYTLTGGSCVANSSGSATINVAPQTVGLGLVDASISMDETRLVGDVDIGGINALMYINSNAQFNAIVSRTRIAESHNLKVADLDVGNKKIKITIYSEPIDLDLDLGQTKQVDLDKDGINDIEVTFADLVVNRAEITIKELDKSESNINDNKQEAETENLNIIQITNINLYNRLKGKIILKVEEHGEAYYIHPTKQEMYYLGRPDDAFRIMREQGIGITNIDLVKIPPSIEDELDINKVDYIFTNKHKGKIFLQVEEHGEAYYVYPDNGLRYYLGRPADAFRIMRELGLGISNDNFSLLSTSL